MKAVVCTASVLFLLAAALPVSVRAQENQIVCTLSEPVALDDDETTFLQHVRNPLDNTFTMRLTYTAGHSWIGVGINTRGNPDKMTPGVAVIGRQYSEDDGRGSFVGLYNLVSDSEDGSGVVLLSGGQRELTYTSFEQSYETETGESVLQFTQTLDSIGLDSESSSDAVWIWAVGLPDNEWEGKHKLYGSFSLDMIDNCVEVEEDEEPASQVEGDNAGDNNDGMSGSTPTTSGGTATEDVASTNPQQQAGDGSSNNAAAGAESSGLVVNSSSATSTYRSMWIAHGALMFLAWGVFAPVAIGVPLLKNSCEFLRENGRWYTIQ